MRDNEYAIMAGVEEQHWWYRSLRARVGMHLEQLAIPQEAVILDAGCGTGANLAFVKDYGRAIGIDMHPQALAFCRDRRLHELSRADVCALPMAEASVDLVLLMDVLEHESISNETRVLEELLRVLKPGGHALINVPAFQWLLSSHDIAVHQNKRYSKGQIVELIRAAGFDRCDATYWNTVLFPIAMLVRLMRRGKSENESDLADYRPGWVSGVLEKLLAVERKLFMAIPAPFGLSVFLVVQKPEA